ncbi:DsbA family protein [candidate division WWE3 bacterium]|nr:DsbA family protein [candidate division WWE3 bacterium]
MPEAYKTKGSASAAVTLIEFSDFQCPACKLYFPMVKQLAFQFPNELKIGYRHFPLPQHPFARKAAEAAEAASAQGKFWEYHDKLFENQESFRAESFEQFARDLGLDLDRFNSEVNGAKYTSIVNQDVDLGKEAGVNATPTFFLNGKKLNVLGPEDLFKKVSAEIGGGNQ